MLSNEDLSVDDVILPKESNAVLCQENIDKVEQMHHHSYENEGKQQTIQESPSFAATVKGSESGAREEDECAARRAATSELSSNKPPEGGGSLPPKVGRR